MALRLLLGATAGLITQDPVDHPLAGIAGMAIGGTAAYYMSYSKDVGRPYRSGKRLKYNPANFSSVPEIKRPTNKMLRIVETSDQLEKLLFRLQNAKKPDGKKIARLQYRIASHEKRMDILKSNTEHILSGRNLVLPQGMDQHRGTAFITNMMGYIASDGADPRIIDALTKSLKLKEEIQTVTSAINPKPKSSVITNITSAMSRADAELALKTHFTDVLGNNTEVATRKSSFILDKFHGTEFSLNNSMFETMEEGKKFSIPLTAHNNGSMRFSKIGDTFYAAKPFNPFGVMYSKGNNLKDKGLAAILGTDSSEKLILKEFDPEESIGFIKNKSRIETLEEWNKKTRPLMEYSAADSPLGQKGLAVLTGYQDEKFTEHARRLSSGAIFFENVVEETKDGSEYAFRQINKMSENGATSEMRDLLAKLSNDFAKDGYNPLAGQSQNSVGYFSAIDQKNLAREPAFISTAERATDAVTSRGYIESKGAKLGRGNEKVLRRLDVDENLSRVISSIFGPEISFNDGAGIIRRSSKGKLAESQYVTLEIAQNNNGTYNLTNSALADAIQEQDPITRRQMLRDIELSSDTVIGYDSNFKESSIGKVYTGGTITDVTAGENKLTVHVKADFDTTTQSWLKLFGPSSKAGYADVADKTYDAISIFSSLYKSGTISVDQSTLGISIDRDTQGFLDVQDAIVKKTNAIHLRNQAKGIGIIPVAPTPDQLANLTEKTIRDSIRGNGPSTLFTDEIKTALKIDSDIMLTAADAGSDSLGIKGRDKLKGILTDAGKMSETGIWGDMARTIVNPQSTDLEVTRASTFIHATMDYKGNSDIFMTLADLARKNNDAQSIADLGKLMGGRLFAEDPAMAEGMLMNIIKNNVKDVKDMDVLTTRVVADLGEGLHGIGKSGSMSWIEHSQLVKSGWTDEMIERMSKSNTDAIYEMQMIHSMGDNGVISDEIKAKNSKELSQIFDFEPEARKNSLNGIVTAPGDYINYNLTLPDELVKSNGIKSIAIPFVSTNRAGFLEQTHLEMLKSMDRAKKELLQVDLEYSAAGPGERKLIKEKYKAKLAALESEIVGLTRGEGNIVKAAMKRAVPGSSFELARSVGGEFSDLIDNGVISQSSIIKNRSGVREIVERMGLDVEDLSFEKVGDTDVYRAMVSDTAGNKTPLLSLVSREPSQGSLSSIIAEVYASKIDGMRDGHVGLGHAGDAGKNIFQMGQFTDFDYDTLRVTGINPADTAAAHEMMRAQNEIFENTKLLMNSMASKGSTSNASKQFTRDWSSVADFYGDQSLNAMKGRQRKILAASATDIAMDMTEALHRRVSSDTSLTAEEKMLRSIKGRTVVHNLTETLIKSAHRSVQSMKDNRGISEIETLQDAYRSLLKGDTEQYRAKTSKAMHSLLGSKTMENIDASNATPQQKAQAKADYKLAIDDIIEGNIENHRQIELGGGRVKDARKVNNFGDMLDNLQKIVSSGTMDVEDFADTGTNKIKSVASRARSMYDNASRNIYKNRKPIAIGLAALGISAATLGAEKPEMTKESIPVSNSDHILPALQSENAPVYKKQGYGRAANIGGEYRSGPNDTAAIRRAIFGDKGSPRTNINIRDKRENRY